MTEFLVWLAAAAVSVAGCVWAGTVRFEDEARPQERKPPRGVR